MICECIFHGETYDSQCHCREQGNLRVPGLLPVDYVGGAQDTGGYSPSE